MSESGMFGALMTMKCELCDWQTPVYRTPISPERKAQLEAQLAEHRRSHAVPDHDESLT